MPRAIYICDSCQQPLELIASEAYPANMVYAPPNSTSFYYRCEQCNILLYGEGLPGKPIEWQELDEQVWEGRIKGVKERRERGALREEKEHLLAEKPEVIHRIEAAEEKLNNLDNILQDLRTKVQALSDRYDEQSAKREQLQRALEADRQRFMEIEDRLKGLIHIK